MKELVLSIITLIASLFISIFVFSIGTLYSLAYSIWLSITLKDWKAFFKFWWKLIDGFAAALGHMIHNIAYGLDLAWNVNGEIIEDIVTAEEDTEFSKKNIPVSSSIGKLQIDNKLNKSGKIFSKALNIAFCQKSHAVDSWLYNKFKRELESKYFQRNLK